MAVDVPRRRYRPGESVTVQFHSACPRNNIRAGGTFLTVERRRHERGGSLRRLAGWLWPGGGPAGGDAGWEVVHTDDDWETKFAWRRPSSLSPQSFATVSWDIPAAAVPGTYRIRHFGDYKHFLGEVHPFSGSSSEFQVVGGARREDWWARLTQAMSLA